MPVGGRFAILSRTGGPATFPASSPVKSGPARRGPGDVGAGMPPARWALVAFAAVFFTKIASSRSQPVE
jgi:hypothetical protein